MKVFEINSVCGIRSTGRICTDIADSLINEGHECIMILNTNEVDAHVNISVYFTDKPAVEDIEIIVPAKRILAFRSSEKEYFGGLELGINEQYSLAFHSDVEIVVQYGRMDVQQSNLAYIGMMGYSE